MDEMGKIGRAVGYGGIERRRSDPLDAENRLLRQKIDSLERQLSDEYEAAAHLRKDMALLREANGQLVRATFGAEDRKEAAEDVSRRQKVFLSMLAHELNNPIAAIMTANGMLLSEPAASPRAEKMAHIVRRQTAHLRRLVDDLLDVARISTGKVSLQTTRVSLHEVIQSAVELSTPMLGMRGHQTVLHLPPEPVMFTGDMVRLSQLFSNLLTNACKFSPPDLPIVVTASAQGDALRVSVKDQGIGIAPQDQARIFELFTQADQKTDGAAAPGLGIGLALVKTIAQLHGGSVQVASEGIGCGSEFSVVLPLAQRPAASA